MSAVEDQKYLRYCIRLAKKGLRNVSPNPMVGAVLVKNGKIIGQGYHAAFGQPHAEVQALNNAKDYVSGATLYCNLEPCCHTDKQTPPCVPEIIKKGIKKVVISNIDPNPRISGAGIRMLQTAGIETKIGLLEEEGAELNRFFFTYITKKRPYVILKIAQSLDGKITSEIGTQTAISDEKSLKDVHKLRAACDVVMVGANTINIDNPLLNVRLVRGKDPLRIILDCNLSCNPNSKIFSGKFIKGTILFAAENAKQERIENFKKKGVKIFFLKRKQNGLLDIHEVLNQLYHDKVQSVLIEGGNLIFSQFLNNDIFDEIIIYQSPVIFGNGLKGFNSILERKLRVSSAVKIGNDFKMVYRL